MRSFLALALCLSLFQTTSARVANPLRMLNRRGAESNAYDRILNWFKSIERRQVSYCVEDEYYTFVNASEGQTFCEAYYPYPNVTTTVDTYTDVVSTQVHTVSSLSRTTPYVTVTTTTTTLVQNMKRNPQITDSPLRRDMPPAEAEYYFDLFRRQDSSASSMNDSQLSASFSSACSCQTYSGSTVTATYTDEPSIVTISAIEETTTTIASTTTAGTLTTTVVDVVTSTTSSSSNSTSATYSATTEFSMTSEVTVLEDSSTSASTSTSSAPTTSATQQAVAFTCPDDNNMTVSQMVGNQRYDYLVLCDTDLTDLDFYTTMASSFASCVAVCSVADNGFNDPVCEGVAYYGSDSVDGDNCFLKTSANSTVSVVGIYVAILQRIAVGISNTTASGTSTESAPFGSPTATMSIDTSSVMNSMFPPNATMPMSMVTSAPVMSGRFVAGQPMYSTTVAGGSTMVYSSAYSTSYNISGTWYYSYYTTFSDAWASTTTVYEAQSTGYAVSNSSTNSYSETSGDNGDYNEIDTQNSTSYGGGYVNATEVITNTTYAANGTELGASTTTLYYSQATGSAGSGSGSGNVDTYEIQTSNTTYEGGGFINTTEVITNTTFASNGSEVSASTTTLYYTQATGTSGSGNSSSSNITVITTNSTVIQSQGSNSGSGGGSSSPGFTSISVYSTETVIVNSGGTMFGSGTIISGTIPTSTSPANTSAIATVVVNTFGSAFGTSFVLSGVITPTPFSTSPPTNTTTGSFSDTDIPRSPFFTSSPIPTLNSSSAAVYTAPTAPSSILITPTPPYPFTNSYAPRVYTVLPNGSTSYYPTTTPNITSMMLPTAPGTVSSGFPSPSRNITAPVTAPSPYPPFTNIPNYRSYTILPNGVTSYYPNTTSSFTPPVLPSTYSQYVAPTPPGTISSGLPTSSPNATTPIAPGTVSSGLPMAPTNSTMPSTPTGTFTNSGLPRSFTIPPATSRRPTSPINSTLLLPTMPVTTAPLTNTCTNIWQGTTTVSTTTTIFACAEGCGAYGNYGGPESFGPPVFEGAPSSTSTSA